MLDIVRALRPVEKEMIPDVTPTVERSQRVGSLATTLHRLDADVSGASLGSLDARIASARHRAGDGGANAGCRCCSASAARCTSARAAAIAGQSARERRAHVTELEAGFTQVAVVEDRVGDRGREQRDAEARRCRGRSGLVEASEDLKNSSRHPLARN